jgi:hypothetical protein
MKSKMLWLVASIVVICMAITFAVISPQQTLLTQCSDQILDYNVCVYMGTIQRDCCIPFGGYWRRAHCQTVERYVYYRQPPQPPSVFFTKRRNCPTPYEACTPMPILRCPPQY